MDLNAVAIFVRVVETESFTAAAAALGLPKSSVSRSISRLEEELGVRLLQRTTRKLSLTDAGAAYFKRVREAMAGLDEAASAVTDMGRDPRGVVRMTAPLDLGVAVLGEILARFVKRHPHIHVDLALTARRVDMVEEGFDLALRAGVLEDSSLVARKLTVTELALFASPAYIRRRGRPKAVADLASHDCVLFRARAGRATWRLSGPDGSEDVDVTGPLAVDELAFVRSAVIEGIGIGLVPSFLCTGAVAQRELVRVLPDHAVRGAWLHLVSPPSRYEPARVTLLRDFLIASFRAVDWTG